MLDGGDVVAEFTDDALSAYYVRGINLIRGKFGSTTRYYLHDAHGDVTALTNSSGTVTKRYSYDVFGNEENPSSDANPFRYCGEYFDKETQTYYLRARYYDPAIGRFTQQDSLLFTTRKLASGYEYADPLSLNLYAYCANNPVLYCDPSGHMPVDDLNALSILYNYGWIDDRQLSMLVLAKNGKNPYTAFHEIAQLNIARQLHIRDYFPILEYPVRGVGEMDVFANGLGWEVKPIGRKGGAQLKRYLDAGGFDVGDPIFPIVNIPIFGNIYMGLVQSPVEPGVVHYFFYRISPLKKKLKVKSAEVKREYLSLTADAVVVCGIVIVGGAAVITIVDSVGGGGALTKDPNKQICFDLIVH